MLRVVAAMVVVAGCFHSATIECADGTVCPAGSQCDVTMHRCITGEQATACTGLADGDPCTLAGAPGTCHDGGCSPAVCGDGIRDGVEPCEGADLGGLTCNDFGYSNPDGLECTADCTFDRSGCSGKCGDGVVDPGEVCDGSPPAGACTDFGFDGGDLACGAGCGTSFASCARFGWLPESTPVATPFGMGGVSAGDLWIVGDQGAVGHYDGTGWTSIASGTTQILGSVWAVASDDVWIGGDNGTLLHWDGQALAPVTAPSDNFLAIWASDSTHVFLAGSYDVYARNGSSWDLVGDLRDGLAAAAGTVVALRGTAPDDLWVASTSSGCGLWHWDGTTWTGTALDVDLGCTLSDLAIDTDGTVWTVGTESSGEGMLFHFDGANTTTLALGTPFPAGLAFVSSSDMWIGSTGQLFYDDGNLSMTSTLPGLQAAAITKMFAAGPSDMAALATNGTLYRFSGRAYAAPTTAVAGTEFWIAPQGAPFIMDPDRSNVWTLAPDATWQETRVATTVNALSGTAANDVWAAATDGVYQFTTSWGRVVSPSMSDPTPQFLAVWSSTSSEVWTSQNHGRIMRYDGASWSSHDLPDATLAPIGFTGRANDVWAIAQDTLHVDQYGLLCQLWHWDGTAWTQITAPDPDLRAIYSPSPGHVVAVAADGHVLTWDGAQWHDTTIATIRPLVMIDGTADADLYAASDSALFHFDGVTWSPMTLPADVRVLGDQSLLAIRARADHLDLLAKGANGYHTLLRTKPF